MTRFLLPLSLEKGKEKYVYIANIGDFQCSMSYNFNINTVIYEEYFSTNCK